MATRALCQSRSYGLTSAMASTSQRAPAKKLSKLRDFLNDYGPGLASPRPTPSPAPVVAAPVSATEDTWQDSAVEVYDDFSHLKPTEDSWSSTHAPVPSRFDWRRRTATAKGKGRAISDLKSTPSPLQKINPPKRVDPVVAEAPTDREAFLKEMSLPFTSPVTNHRARFPRRTTPSMQDLKPSDPMYEEITAYGTKFITLLEHEQATERVAVMERLRKPMHWLQSQGYCISELQGEWLDMNTFGRPVAAFTLGEGATLPVETRFEPGVQVILSASSELPPNHGGRALITGAVVSRSETQIRVSFTERFAELSGSYRLDLGHSDLIHLRMTNALHCLQQDPLAIEKHPMNVEHLTSTGNVIDPNVQRKELMLQGTHLRDVILAGYKGGQSGKGVLQPPTDTSYPSHEVLDHQSRLPSTHRSWGACCEKVDETKEAEPEDRLCSAFASDMRIQSWARRYRLPNPVRVEGDPELKGLNECQTRAMAMMIGERMSLVQGPPGTGKTKTIIETIKLLKLHFQVTQPILVSTFTNVAVDNLAEGLAKAGLRPLRVASQNKASKESLRKHTLDYKLEKHRLQKELSSTMQMEHGLQDTLDKYLTDEKALVALAAASSLDRKGVVKLEHLTRNRHTIEKKIAQTRGRMYAMRQEMFHDCLAETDVICTTCITSACTALNVVDFPIVFLDEASMSTEPASLIPIMKGSQHVALIGDHKQLPPVIVSLEASAQGLAVSLFERLTREGVVPSIMLDIQYRMHPAISQFPSSEFYEHTLQDGTVDSTGHIAEALAPPQSKHLKPNSSVAFLNHAGSEQTRDRSRVNLSEANIICDLVQDLLVQNPTLRGQDIGIIAPYAAQISLMTRIFNTDPKYRKQFRLNLDEERAQELSDIEIRTVDGFEGREKEVIIFSTVRNNPGGYIGFLADRRRLNVGLTRAKRALFVIGSLTTLQEGKVGTGVLPATHALVKTDAEGPNVWRRYTEFLTREGLVVQLKGNATRATLMGASLEDMGRGDLGIDSDVSVADAYDAYFPRGQQTTWASKPVAVPVVRARVVPQQRQPEVVPAAFYAQFGEAAW